MAVAVACARLSGLLAQVCGAILVKLIMDLWIAAGPANSFVLVLRMLRKAITARKPQAREAHACRARCRACSPPRACILPPPARPHAPNASLPRADVAQIRARAFDLIYNITVHASLLEPLPSAAPSPSPPAAPPAASQPRHATGDGSASPFSPAAAAAAGGAAQPSPSPSHAAGGAGEAAAGMLPTQSRTPSPPAQGGRANGVAEEGGRGGGAGGGRYARLSAWCRALLFQLLDDISRVSSACVRSVFLPVLASFWGRESAPAPLHFCRGMHRSQHRQAGRAEGLRAAALGGLRVRLLHERCGAAARSESWSAVRAVRVVAQGGEEEEVVWLSALNTLLQLCTSGGHWVARHVEALPLQGLAGLLGACLAFRWCVVPGRLRLGIRGGLRGACLCDASDICSLLGAGQLAN